MGLSSSPLKGMRQCYPDELRLERFVTDRMLEAGRLYGFEEFEAPLLESMELYLAKSGSELAREQSYNFTDKGGREVVLRPELTPSLARMISAKGREMPRPIRWMSMPLCYRYERPQRGRVREFVQFNCDILGCEDLTADLEIMLVLRRIMRSLGATPGQFEIRFSSRRLASDVLSSLGSVGEAEMQLAFGLMDKRSKMPPADWEQLLCERVPDASAREALARFMDCGSVEDPWLGEVVGERSSLAEVRELERMIRDSGLDEARFDASIVRGLDYYTGVVFELMDTGSENRRAICGGGRYDDLAGIFGGERITGVGFGLGVLSLMLFLKTYDLVPGSGQSSHDRVDVFAAVMSGDERALATCVAESLRDVGLRVAMDIQGRSLSRQLGQANRMGARWTVIIGPEERSSGCVTLRDMRSGAQESLPIESLPERVSSGSA